MLLRVYKIAGLEYNKGGDAKRIATTIQWPATGRSATEGAACCAACL